MAFGRVLVRDICGPKNIVWNSHAKFKVFLFAMSVIIGNAKQIDCMEGNFVHILQRIFGFAAELE